MEWIVEVTDERTGEKLVVQVDAGTHDDAIARARDEGLTVRDCYPVARGFYKWARIVAWVWCGLFAIPALTVLLIGLGGCFARQGNAEIRSVLVFAAGLAVLSVLGHLTARAMTHELRRGYEPDPRRGFDVVSNHDATATSPGVRPEEPKR